MVKGDRFFDEVKRRSFNLLKTEEKRHNGIISLQDFELFL
jgi:hypothetical protein